MSDCIIMIICFYQKYCVLQIYIRNLFSFGKNWLHSKLFVKLVYALCLGSGYQKLKTTFSHFDHSRCCSVFFDIINTANIKYFECSIRIMLTRSFIRGMSKIILKMQIILLSYHGFK